MGGLVAVECRSRFSAVLRGDVWLRLPNTTPTLLFNTINHNTIKE